MFMPKVDIKIDIRKVKRTLIKTAWFLAKQAFLSFIIFIFIALFIGGAIFYYYGFLKAAKEPEVTIKTIQLNDKLYQQFLDNYRQRKEIFNQADSKIFPNPFAPGEE